MKILLIDPPFYIFTGYVDRWFSPGLASIASVLRGCGHDVVICQTDLIEKHNDVNFNSEYQQLQHYLECLNNRSDHVWKKVGKIIEQEKPDIVGITALTMKFGSVVRVAEIVKKVAPTATVLVGGSHATTWPAMCLSVPEIDFCLRGEAEEAVIDFVNAFEGRGGVTSFHKVAGLCFRGEAGDVIQPSAAPPKHLSQLPLVARDLFMFPQAYSSEDMGLLLTTRGCPYHCTFCSHERNVRFRSLDDVFKEIHHVVDTYGTKQFAFKDDSFSIKRKRTMEFCQRLIDEKIDINWEITTRVNLVDDEMVDLMMEAGLNVMKVGVESGSPRILKQIEKTATKSQMRSVAALFNRKGLFWSGYFMYGLPDETEKDFKATYRFMKELNPMYAGLGLYAPMPDTPLWDQGVEMGLVIPDSDLTVDHFFKTNPKDYFLKDPSRRVRAIDPQRFEELGQIMSNKFNNHNTGFGNLVRRAIARKKAYRHDPLLFGRDVIKGLKWAFPSWVEQSVKKGKNLFK